MKTFRASSMDRRLLCPGSALAEALAASLPAKPEDSSANTGSRKHWIIAERIKAANAAGKHPLEGANDALDYDVLYCLAAIESLDGVLGMQVESELSMKVGSEKVSGTPDLMLFFEDRISIYDWKTGWGAAQKDANANIQLMTYAWLAFRLLATGNGGEVKRVSVTLVRPNAEPEDRLTRTEYGRELLEQMNTTMADIVHVCTDDAPRKPSPEACKWCLACGTQACAESTATAETLALEKRMTELPAVPDAELLRLADVAVVAEKVCEAIKAELKRRLKDCDLQTPNWSLTPGGARRSIEDTYAAWTALKDALGTDPADRSKAFLAACTLSTSGVEELAGQIAARTGSTKKAATADLYDKLGALVTKKEQAPRLTRRAAK